MTVAHFAATPAVGAGGPTGPIELVNRNASSFEGVNSVAGIRLQSAGSQDYLDGKIGSENYVSYNTWLKSGVATDYEFRATRPTGNTTILGAPLSVWLNSYPILWYIRYDVDDGDDRTAQLVIEGRLKGGDGTILSTSTHNLTVGPI